jgi:D-beta-D-heptose 7-phosphate kinase/D-beta-D-heptose 1-phosphate adenosyltransferase
MKRASFSRLKELVGRFGDRRVLVIGDLILDKFIWGKVERISPEAPVPVVWVEKESIMPGGASNVANNIASLGGKVEIVGVVGCDEYGRILKSGMKEKGIGVEGVFEDGTRPTVLKTRIIAHKQQLVRIDREMLKPVTLEVASKLLFYVKRKIADEKIDILIIEDYGKGVVSPMFLKGVLSFAKKHKIPIAVDPKEDHFSFYKNATVITPNMEEAAKASGVKMKEEKDIEKAGKKLLEKLKCEMVLITLGERGMALFKKERRPLFIPTIAQDVYDVSGAGDTVIAVFSLALASGASAS